MESRTSDDSDEVHRDVPQDIDVDLENLNKCVACQFNVKYWYWTKNTSEESLLSVSWRKTALWKVHGSKSHLVNHNWLIK